jgi:hypothetical protein
MNEENKNKTPLLKNVKFVGVTFDPDSFKNGENELNKAIEMGYKVITDYPTSTGVQNKNGLVQGEQVQDRFVNPKKP